MVDTDFEKDSRAHSFWQEWQKSADQATEPETITEHLASVSEDWAVVVNLSSVKIPVDWLEDKHDFTK